MRIILCYCICFLGLIASSIAQERSKELLLPLLEEKIEAKQIDTQRVNILNELSWAYHRSHADSSKLYAEEAYEFADNLNYGYGRARALNLLAIYYSNLGESQIAMELNDSCYKIAQEVPDSFLMSAALNDNANILSSYGEYSAALEEYFKALDLTPQKNILGRVFTLSNIGLTYQALSNDSLANRYILNSIELSKNSKDQFIETSALINYIDYLYREKDFYNARDYAQKALRLAKKYEDNFTLILAYIFLADMDQEEKLFESSLNYFGKAESIAISSNSLDQLLYIYGSMATIYNEQKKPNQTLFFADKAMESIGDQETQDANPWLFQLYASAYSMKGEFEKAYEYQKIATEKIDTLSQKNLDEALDKVTIQNDLAKARKAKELAEAEQSKQQEELNYQKKFSQALLFVGLLAISLIIVLFSAYRAKNKYNSELVQKVDQQTTSLKQKNIELEASNQELENFAHITSHDLKEPIRNILSFSKILLDKKDSLNSEQRQHYTDIVYSRAKRVNILLEDVLEFSRIKKQIREIQTIEPTAIIKTVEEEIKELLQEKNGQVNYASIPSIQFAETELFLILKNLIENGIKYNQSPNPQVDIEYSMGGDHHHFKVKDNGIGVDDDYKNKIFNMFFRLHNKQEYDGTGLGLAICRRIIDKAGGKIWLESKQGQGSTFHFTIPTKIEKG